MAQTREEIDQTLAERLCWQAARRDDSRVARLSAVWTGGLGWVTVERQGFTGSRASGPPV
jgi:hypothetical protein